MRCGATCSSRIKATSADATSTTIDQALCLTLVTNACVLWTTTYLADTIDALRADGIEVSDEIAAHLTRIPAG